MNPKDAVDESRDPAIAVAIDSTPLLGHRTGVGNYVASLLHAANHRDDISLTGYAISLRGIGRLGSKLPDNVRSREIPLPANLLIKHWANPKRDEAVNSPSLDMLLGQQDVVHGTNFFVPPTRSAMVVTVHDLTCVRLPYLCTPTSLMYPKLVQSAIDRGAIVHVPTNAIGNEVREEFRIEPDRVVPIHHGFDATALGEIAAQTRAKRGTKHPHEPWGDNYVVAVGTIEPRKNYVRLIEAFEVLARRHKDVHLVIVGQIGWDAERVKTAIEEVDSRDRIHLTGWQSDERRFEIMAGARCLAFVSLYEGFGIPPLEAMALGVPVVAASVPAVSEVCGGACASVSPTNTAEIADALDNFLPESAQRSRVISEGHDRVKHFSWKKTADKTAEMYARALER